MIGILGLSTWALGGAPPLERWRTLEVAAHTLERWHALPPLDFGLTLVLSVGEVAALIPHLATSLPPHGAPSSLGTPTIFV